MYLKTQNWNVQPITTIGNKLFLIFSFLIHRHIFYTHFIWDIFSLTMNINLKKNHDHEMCVDKNRESLNVHYINVMQLVTTTGQLLVFCQITSAVLGRVRNVQSRLPNLCSRLCCNVIEILSTSASCRFHLTRVIWRIRFYQAHISLCPLFWGTMWNSIVAHVASSRKFPYTVYHRIKKKHDFILYTPGSFTIFAPIMKN